VTRGGPALLFVDIHECDEDLKSVSFGSSFGGAPEALDLPQREFVVRIVRIGWIVILDSLSQYSRSTMIGSTLVALRAGR